MGRMTYDRLPKRSETKHQEGLRKRGRTQLRWKDRVKRDLRKAEEDDKWREKADTTDQWKQITKVAVRRSDQWIRLTPTQRRSQDFGLGGHPADATHDLQKPTRFGGGGG